MAPLSKPREAALKALVLVEKDGAYLNIALRDILSASDMGHSDKALTSLLAIGSIRNKLYIDNIIKNLSSIKLKKLSVWIHNILRIGIFSIKFLDRIPDSATVNECVRLARRYGHGASAGFVNAVLRKAINSGDFLPEDVGSPEYTSIKYSFPLWLTQKWISNGYGEDFFAAMNNEPSVNVRLNTLKAQSLGDNFTKNNLSPYSYTYIGRGSVENTPEFISGEIAVQDGASQKAIAAFGVQKNMKILDLCSAPGGKTGFMAQLMENSGHITACDIHSHKLELIEQNLKRLGVTNFTTLSNDATSFNKNFENAFDMVLCDVPCSGLGVIRRRPDIKWTKSIEGNNEIIKIQQKILDTATPYVKKGGRLMYSTCTINKEENEENVKYLLKNNPSFSLLEQFEKDLGRQLLPHTDETDGFFYAIFERK